MLSKNAFFCQLLRWETGIVLLLFTPLVYAAGGGESTVLFLWIAVLLLLAKTFSSLFAKLKQPAVLGELIVGVILGNLALIGVNWFEPIQSNEIMKYLAELGVVILLFQIGLESNVEEMLRVGWRAFMVATIGVIVPFILGTYIVGPYFIPDQPFSAYLFLGATLTATSVGITGRVFQDLGKIRTPEAQIVLSAAVLDDVMGLIILAVVSAIVTTGVVDLATMARITLEAFVFLISSIFLGRLLAPWIGKMLSKIHPGIGMKFTLAISFCLIFSYLAYIAGLAPIIGAFAAGLMLEKVPFESFENSTVDHEIRTALVKLDDNIPNNRVKQEVVIALDNYRDHHLERLIIPLEHFLVPLFFIMTGMQVNLEILFDTSVLWIALIVTVAAFAGKIVSGIAAGPVNKYIVGWGMAPRGEVGLIFAMVGNQLGVVSETMFSVIIIMVILTTLLTPPILSYLLRKHS